MEGIEVVYRTIELLADVTECWADMEGLVFNRVLPNARGGSPINTQVATDPGPSPSLQARYHNKNLHMKTWITSLECMKLQRVRLSTF
jgi:hypothetical protein